MRIGTQDKIITLKMVISIAISFLMVSLAMIGVIYFKASYDTKAQDATETEYVMLPGHTFGNSSSDSNVLKTTWHTTLDSIAENFQQNVESLSFQLLTAVPEGYTAGPTILDTEHDISSCYKLNAETNMYDVIIYSDVQIIAPINADALFMQFANIKTIDFTNFKVSDQTTSIGGMFYNCTKLTSLDLNHWDVSKVTNITYTSSHTYYNSVYQSIITEHTHRRIFENCSSLNSLNISDLKFSSLTDMASMFDGCLSLSSLNISNWDTGNVIQMSSMFQNCSSLITLDISNWDTGNVIQMSSMFQNCSSLITLDISNWDTGNVIQMSSMFQGCSALTSINLSNWNTKNVGDMSHMFSGCSLLEYLDVSKWDVSSLYGTMEMFKDCSLLKTINLSGWRPAVNANFFANLNGMFYGCSSLTAVDLSGFDLSSVGTNSCSNTFVGTDSLKVFVAPLYVYRHAYLTINGTWYNDKGICFNGNLHINGDSDRNSTLNEDGTITKRVYYKDGMATLPNDWFSKLSSITTDKTKINSIEFKYLDAAPAGYSEPITILDSDIDIFASYKNVTITNSDESTTEMFDLIIYSTSPIIAPVDCSHLFEGFINVSTIDMENFLVTSQTTNMSSMFNSEIYNAPNWHSNSKLISIDVSTFDTSNVTDFSKLFCGLSALTSLDLSNWNTKSVTDLNSMFRYCQALEEISFGEMWKTDNVTNMSNLFHSCKTLTSLDLTSWNTEKVTQMNNMFSTCETLQEISFGEMWKTDNVASMTNMFYGCKKLTSLNLSSWNTEKVTNFSDMFNGCSDLTTLNVSNFNTSSATNLSGMFMDCSALTTLNVSNFNTSSATNLSDMFRNCSALTTLNVSNFNTSSATYLYNMFSGCKKLTSLDLTYWNTEKVTTFSDMFNGCSDLTTLNVSNFNTSSATNLSGMFRGCKKLTSLDLNSWNTSNVTSLAGIFYNCSALEELYVSNWNTEKVLTLQSGATMTNYLSISYSIFTNCSSLKTLDLSNWSTASMNDPSSMFANCSSLESITFGENFTFSNATKLNTMFYNCSSLKALNLSSWDTQKVTNMGAMFAECSALEEINVANWNTEKVKYFHSGYQRYGSTNVNIGIFSGCSSLKTLDLSSWSTASASSLQGLFTECSSLESIVFGESFTVSNSSSISWMFYMCSSLKNLDLSNWNTSNVVYMSYLFCNCYKLENITFGESWNTEKVQEMQSMFSGCFVLTSIDLDNWNTANVTNMDYMFQRCEALISLDLSSFDIKSLTSATNMIKNMTALETFVAPYASNNKPILIYGTDYDQTWLHLNSSEVYGNLYICNGQTSTAGYPMNLLSTLLEDGSVEKSIMTRLYETLPKTWFDSLSTVTTDKSTINSIKFTQSSTALEGYSEPIVVLDSTNDIFISYLYNSTTELYDVIIYSKAAIIAPSNCYELFADLSNMSNIEFDNFYLTQFTYQIAGMFACDPGADFTLGNYKLTSLDLSHFNTRGVSYMGGLFSGLRALNSLDLAHFDTSNVTEFQVMFNFCESLTTLDLSSFDSGNVTNMQAMFQSCKQLSNLILPDNFITSTVTTADYMFTNCLTLSNFSFLTTWNTENITNMRYMFNNTNASTLNLSSFNTSSATSMEGMFNLCKNLSSITFGDNWNTDGVTNMSRMFSNNLKLTDLSAVENWNTQNVTNMFNIFFNCQLITELDLSNWNVSIVTDMSWMFQNCYALENLNISTWQPSAVTKMEGMFLDCSSLKHLDLTNFDLKSVEVYSRMIDGLTSLKLFVSPYCSDESKEFDYTSTSAGPWKHLNTHSDFDYLVISNDTLSTINEDGSIKNSVFTKGTETLPQNWFSKLSSVVTDKFKINSISFELETTAPDGFSAPITILDSEFDILASYKYDTTTDMYDLVIYCQVPIIAPVDSSSLFRDYCYLSKLTFNNFFVTNQTTNMSSMFKSSIYLDSQTHNNTKLLALDVSNFDTSNVTSMYGLFHGCKGLTSLDLSSFNTTSVTDMLSMFNGCESLTSLDLSSFNTISVTNMANMFNGCESLTSLDLNSFNTSSVTNMASMFDGCESLTSLDLNSFNTFSVTNMSRMFLDCNSLTSLNLSLFNVSNVKTMEYMFFKCAKLTELDLSSFNTINVENMNSMFCACYELTTLTLPSTFVTDKVRNMYQMFTNCQKLSSINLDSFNTSLVENMGSMFQSCQQLETITFPSTFTTNKVTNMSQMFNNCLRLKSIDLSNFNTSLVINMENMFYSCTSLKILNLGSFDMKSVTDYSNMISYMPNLQVLIAPYSSGDNELDITGTISGTWTHLNTGDIYDRLTITNTSGNTMSTLMPDGSKRLSVLAKTTEALTSDWFDRLYSIAPKEQINSISFKLRTTAPEGYSEPILIKDSTYDINACYKVDENTNLYDFVIFCEIPIVTPTNATGLFADFTNLTNFNFDNFFISPSTLNVSEMFKNCSTIKSLDLHNFATGNVQNFSSMFLNCSSLATLNLSAMDIKSCTNSTDFIKGCNKLMTIVAPFSSNNVVTIELNNEREYYVDGNENLSLIKYLTNDSSIYSDASLSQDRNNTLTLMSRYQIIYKDKDNQEFTGTFDSDYPKSFLNEDSIALSNPIRQHYTFEGWYLTPDCIGAKITHIIPADYSDNLTLYANWNVVQYTVTWVDGDDEIILSKTYDYGSIPTYEGSTPTKQSTAQYSYTFNGWDREFTIVDQDTTYYAQFTENLRSYTITWLNEDGSELETDENVLYGETPTYDGETPTKDATIQFTYTFAGWDNEIVAVTGNATYTATFTSTVNEYTITWKNDDETIIDTTTVAYGEMPTHADPTKDGDAQYTYTFAGWTPAVVQVTGDATYTATFTSTINTYTITWKNDDGSTIDTTTVAYGDMPTHADPTKTATDQYTYTFAGWEPTVIAATADATYTAKFNEITNTYTITWLNEDGTELEKDENVPYGETPTYNGETPTKDGDAQYSYSFAGWDPEVAEVTSDATYTATFTQTTNTYTITWKNHDGSILEIDENVYYGATPSYDKPTPTKDATAQFTYAFAGWDPEVAEVTGDATYTAKFNEITNTYTITWLNEDGTELEKDENVPYGETPTYNGETPTKDGDAQYSYSFAGWDPEVSEVSGDAIYTATFTQIINTYTITWKNYDGTTLEKDENVPYGDTPTYDREKPTKDGNAQYSYTFAGWDPEVVYVTGDATYKATFTQITNTYTITWINDDRSSLEIDENVPYGEIPTYDGETPTKTGTADTHFEFKGWSPEVSEVTGDTTYTATYEGITNTYTIKWLHENGDELEIDENVPYGEIPTYDGEKPTKDATIQYSYEFAGWEPIVIAATADATYTAKFNEIINTYTITWLNEDGTELEKDIDVQYGSMPNYDGETPTKDGDAQYSYSFAGWDPEVAEVTGDATYQATFTQTTNTYTITWKNYDGSILKIDENVYYGATPSYDKPTPTKDATAQFTYTFAGWDPEVAEVTGDATYTAKFNEITNTYTITWLNEDGTELEKDENVPYGETPTYNGETPTKYGNAQYSYSFAGWDPEVAEVTGDVTYTAKFNEITNTYTITWLNEDGTELEKDENVPYGETPTYNGEKPTKDGDAQYSYSFAGWDPEVAEVTGEATYYATFTQTTNTYTITWKNFDGTTLEKDENVPYGNTPTYDSEEPTKPSTEAYYFTFDGWNPNVTEVTCDATYYAKFTENRRTYTITWIVNEESFETIFEYGEFPSCGFTPTKDMDTKYIYQFDHWDPQVTPVTGDASYTAIFTTELRTYTITWLNEDESLLETDTDVPYGTMPNYDGKKPTKDGNAQYSYTFVGWDPEVTKVSGDATYTAKFNESTNLYTIIWKDYNGNTIKTHTVEYGKMPEAPADPTRAPDAQYTYTFSGWTPEITAVTETKTYTATYSTTTNEYTVKWVINGETVETDENVPYGTIPSYDGSTPTKEATKKYTYTFSRWTPDNTKGIVGDTTFEALFTDTINRYTITSSINEHGTITPLGETTLNYGSKQTYLITPNVGYFISKIIVDGVEQEFSNNSYTFEKLEDNHTIHVECEIIKFTITLEIKQNGKTIAIEEFIVEYNKSISIDLSKYFDAKLVRIIVDDQEYKRTKIINLENVISNIEISALYAEEAEIELLPIIIIISIISGLTIISLTAIIIRKRRKNKHTKAQEKDMRDKLNSLLKKNFKK